MRPRIFITQPVAASAIERLRAVAELTLNPDALHIATKDELLAAVRGNDVLFCLLHDRVDRDVIGANPRLRMIATMTITPADIDVAEATARRIPVTVIPAPLLNDATADLTWALILGVARRVVEGDRIMRTGVFAGAQSTYFVGGGVSGRVLGIVGCGGIGRAVARRARGFGTRLLYYDPRRVPDAEAAELGLTWVPLDRLLGESDFVSIHASLTPETRHLIDAAALARMKPTAVLVNTARGPVVDEAALVDALRSGTIAGAALDVHER